MRLIHVPDKEERRLERIWKSHSLREMIANDPISLLDTQRFR